MTITEHEITSETLPPVQCTSWCDKGDGHTDADHPDDQFCVGEARRVGLTRYPLIEYDKDTRIRDYVDGQLYRMAGAVSTHIQLDRSGTPLIELTIAEAEHLANDLLELVKAARA